MANIGDLFPQLASNAKDALIKIGAIFKKNSFACCTSIKPLERSKIINTADHIGDLLEDDLRLITNHLSESEVIPNSIKRRFGLL